MPLTAEQKTAIQALKDIAAEDADEFATELKAANSKAHHAVFRAGFTEAEGRWKPRAEAAETAKTKAEQEKATAEQQLKDAQEKAPDVAKVNEQWQAKWDKRESEHTAAIEAEKSGRKAEREARKLSDLRAELNGLDPIYVDAVVKSKADRIRFKEDGTAELFEDGSDIPVQVPTGKTPYAVLAAEIKSKADPKWVLAGGDTGSGTQPGTGGSGYDPVAAGKKLAAEQKAGAGQDSLAFK